VTSSRGDRSLRRGAFASVVEGLLAEGISVRFRAGGRSMTPTIDDGEVLIVAPAAAHQLAVADVAFCQTRARSLAHRVLSVARDAAGAHQLTLCGDAALECDGPVTAAEVRGRVVAVERAGQRVDMEVKAGLLGRLATVAALELRRSLRRWRARAWLGPLAPTRAAG
jgi:hypothetical protein